MKIKLFVFLLLSCVLLFGLSPSAKAGGPIVVDGGTGLPYTWRLPIDLHPENGICAGFSNQEMIEKVDEVFGLWEQPGFFDLEFDLVTGALGQDDVDENNFGNFIALTTGNAAARDGLNPVIFDNTGEIINSVFGQNTAYLTVLGFAGPSNFATISGVPRIIDGQAFFNCRCLEGHQDGNCEGGFSFPESNLDFIILHEMGHFLGLDHADLALANYFPTMYPQLRDANQQLELSEDDRWAISSLYGLEQTQAQTGTVMGEIVDSGGDPIRCLNVIATPTDDVENTLTTVTGYYATYSDNNNDQDSDDEGECLSDCGVFRLTGLDLNKTYSISIEALNENWIQGSAVGPCIQDQPQIQDAIEVEAIEFSDGESLVQVEAEGDIEDNDDNNNGDNSTANRNEGGCQMTKSNPGHSNSYVFLILLIFVNIIFWEKRKGQV